jgi:hypothetical protein
MVAGKLPKGIKRPKRVAVNLLRPRDKNKCPRDTYIPSSTTSRPAKAPKELPIQLLQGNFPRGLSGQGVRLTIYYDLVLRLECYSYMNILLHKFQTGYGAKRASYPIVAGEHPKGKSNKSVGRAIYYNIGLR